MTESEGGFLTSGTNLEVSLQLSVSAVCNSQLFQLLEQVCVSRSQGATRGHLLTIGIMGSVVGDTHLISNSDENVLKEPRKL